MSTDNVTPIRRGSSPTEPPKRARKKTTTPPHPVDFEDALIDHLEQARGICDLVTARDEDRCIALDAIPRALDSAIGHLDAALELVEKIYAAIRKEPKST